MADVKWMGDLSAAMPFSAAAKHVLALRLGSVAERLPLALHHADEDCEHVHQLRVSTRRAGAAVRIFAECLEAKAERKVKRALKRIRRAAGAARDWDVFQEMIVGRMPKATASQKPAFDLLLGLGQGQRTAAQIHLAELTDLDDDFATIVSAALASLDETPVHETFRSRAIPLMTNLLRELDAAAALDLNDYEKLHQVRILGKQLRYAMEIFAGCFEAGFRETIYPAVEEMQEILGDANDSHVALQRLQEIRTRLEMTQPKAWPRYRTGLQALQRAHQRRLPEKRAEFLTWWTTWQSSGMEKQFETMLRSN